jgi:hypothetical protein
MATLDDITQERKRIAERLARLTQSGVRLAEELAELEAAERVFARLVHRDRLPARGSL